MATSEGLSPAVHVLKLKMPDSALGLFLILITSLVSSWYMYLGFREKSVPRLLIGVGTGIPSLGVFELNYWMVAAAFCFAGVWLQRYMDGG